MTRWLAWPAVSLVCLLAGWAGGYCSAPEPPPAKVEQKREAEKEQHASAVATAEVRTVEVAGPTRTVWRTAPAAPGCPEVREVIHEAGPVERIVAQATKTAMESTAKEKTRETTTTVVALRPDWSVHLLGGVAPLHLHRGEWVAGLVVTRRIGGPFALGAFGLVRPDVAGSLVGLTLGLSW